MLVLSLECGISPRSLEGSDGHVTLACEPRADVPWGADSVSAQENKLCTFLNRHQGRRVSERSGRQSGCQDPSDRR